MAFAISPKSFTDLACTANASRNSDPPSKSTIKLLSNLEAKVVLPALGLPKLLKILDFLL